MTPSDHTLTAGGEHERRGTGEVGPAVLVRHIGDLVQQQTQVRQVVSVPPAPPGD